MLRDNATAPAASKPNLKRDATHSRTMALMTAWACMVTYSSPNACPPSRLLSHAPPTVHTLDMMIFPAHPGGGVGYQPLCMYVPRETIILDSGERVPISGPAAIPTARFVQSFAGGGGLFCYLWCSNSEETLDKKTVTTVMHGSVRLCRLLRWF
jgi:hypothetical protein